MVSEHLSRPPLLIFACAQSRFTAINTDPGPAEAAFVTESREARETADVARYTAALASMSAGDLPAAELALRNILDGPTVARALVRWGRGRERPPGTATQPGTNSSRLARGPAARRRRQHHPQHAQVSGWRCNTVAALGFNGRRLRRAGTRCCAIWPTCARRQGAGPRLWLCFSTPPSTTTRVRRRRWWWRVACQESCCGCRARLNLQQ